MATLTPRQQQVLDLIRREPFSMSRRVAGELGLRSQDAGRTLASLERRGLVELRGGEQTGEISPITGRRLPGSFRVGYCVIEEES